MCVYHILIYQDYVKGGDVTPPPPHFRDVIYVTWTSPPHVRTITKGTYLWMLITLVENRRSSMNFTALLEDKWEGIVIVMSPLLYVHMLFLISCIIRYYLSFPLTIDICIYIYVYYIYIWSHIYVCIYIGYKGAAPWSQALASNRIALSISPLASNFCRCSWQPMPPVAAKAAM